MDVEIVTDEALYKCCGSAWQARSGYEQTYRGRVVSREGGWLTIAAMGLGTITYMASVREGAAVITELT